MHPSSSDLASLCLQALSYVLNAVPADATNPAGAFNITSASAVNELLTSATRVCTPPATSANYSAAKTAVAGLIATTNSLAASSMASLNILPLTSIIYLVKLIGAVQQSVAPLITPAFNSTTLDKALDTLETAVEAFPARVDAILASLRLPSPAVYKDLTITPTFFGPVANTSLNYASMLQLSQSTVNVTASSTALVRNASTGLYEVVKRGMDPVLNASVPMNIPAVLPFPPTNGTAVITPMAPIIFLGWLSRQSYGPTLPTADDWKSVYETVTGLNTTFNYLTQNWPADSAVAASVKAADVMVLTLPMLVSRRVLLFHLRG